MRIRLFRPFKNSIQHSKLNTLLRTPLLLANTEKNEKVAFYQALFYLSIFIFTQLICSGEIWNQNQMSIVNAPVDDNEVIREKAFYKPVEFS